MTNMVQLGRRGETLAKVYLQGLNYCILAQNYTVRGGEIDIIAQDGDTIVFVEVKTRRKNAAVSGVEAVDLRKQRFLIRTARQYLADNGHEAFCRFDVIEVCLDCPHVIQHYQDAFEAS